MAQTKEEAALKHAMQYKRFATAEQIELICADFIAGVEWMERQLPKPENHFTCKDEKYGTAERCSFQCRKCQVLYPFKRKK